MGMASGMLACAGASGASVAPVADLAGLYILESIDDAGLPIAYLAAPGDPSCPTMITEGELVLRPRSVDALPLYDVSIFARPVCDSVQFPEPKPVISDIGQWAITDATVTFRSSHTGTTTGTADVTGAPAAIRWLAAGHVYLFRRIRLQTSVPSYVGISDVDESGNPIAGMQISWRASDGVVGCCGITSSGSVFVVMGPPITGSVRIWVAAPPGYALAPTQPNPIDVATVGGRTTSLVIHLVTHPGP